MLIVVAGTTSWLVFHRAPQQNGASGNSTGAPVLAASVGRTLADRFEQSEVFASLTFSQRAALTEQVEDLVAAYMSESDDDVVRLVESWGGRLREPGQFHAYIEHVRTISDPYYHVRSFRTGLATLSLPDYRLNDAGQPVEHHPKRMERSKVAYGRSIFEFDDAGDSGDADMVLVEMPVEIPGRARGAVVILWFRWSEARQRWSTVKKQMEYDASEWSPIGPIF